MCHESRDGIKDGKMRMIKWMCGVFLKERQPSTELRRHLGEEAIGDVMRRSRLRWHGHCEKKGTMPIIIVCTRLVVEGTAPGSRAKKTCQNTVLTCVC